MAAPAPRPELAHQAADRLRRRAHAAADRSLRAGQRAARPGLRAGVRLRPGPRQLAAWRARLLPGIDHGPGLQLRPDADLRRADRSRGTERPGADPPARG